MIACMQNGMPYTMNIAFHAQFIKVNSIIVKKPTRTWAPETPTVSPIVYFTGFHRLATNTNFSIKDDNQSIVLFQMSFV